MAATLHHHEIIPNIKCGHNFLIQYYNACDQAELDDGATGWLDETYSTHLLTVAPWPQVQSQEKYFAGLPHMQLLTLFRALI